ncbi:S-adenosylmethionine-dependent methyltransferase [Onishia taeanensis]|uniref:tRNA 5-carboxymethoxyuridine methyltransferase n=1 Tax=Onishia taeanensis TaxID=284577 RepID=A0A328XZR9_9GAMM|nr:methyltransferase domain-containing protein [Halomonas taeanensis]RAR62215.1 S-adenosylmethionine-dependent methyltransferase [Halomonas taeanensis]
MVANSSSHSPAAYLSEHGDRYFDGLADKFAAGLYGSARGDIRLAVLDHWLPRHLELARQPVLDVGGGLGQMARWFAQRNHPVTLLEPSGEMLALARQALADTQVELIQAPLQDLAELAPGPWPLIVCHAVLEWLFDPRDAFMRLAEALAPGGQLSLMVFNRDALRLSNVVKGNLDKVLADRLAGTGQRQRLTPISPLTNGQIETWAGEAGLTIKARAGVRIFHDYLQTRELDSAALAKLVELERRYCDAEPHWRLGRYLLYTLTRPAAAVDATSSSSSSPSSSPSS